MVFLGILAIPRASPHRCKVFGGSIGLFHSILLTKPFPTHVSLLGLVAYSPFRAHALGI